MSASTIPPAGLTPRQLDQAQIHADNMQALEDIKTEQALSLEIAQNRKQLATLNLESSMIEEQATIIQQYPVEYIGELREFNFPSVKEVQQQESIDISDQQPAENTEIETSTPTEQQQENKN